MKTFNEAIGMIYADVRGWDVDSIEKGAQKIHDTQERYAEFASQAHHSEELEVAMKAWVSLARAHNLESALFTAFMTGLITGIEMEKAE